MSRPMSPDDPAYWMLLEGLADPDSRPVSPVFDAGCYICRDPEFRLMGLPLCYACIKCAGHVPADDTRCTVCKHDNDNDQS